MGSTFLRRSKEMASRVVSVVILVEIVIFFVPTNGKVEGRAAGYWDVVRLRLSSGDVWVLALLSGIGTGGPDKILLS